MEVMVVVVVVVTHITGMLFSLTPNDRLVLLGPKC